MKTLALIEIKGERFNMGYVKTAFLMGLIVFLFTTIGYWLGGSQGLTLALIFALATNFGAYWFSDQFLLKMYKAKRVDENSSPEIYTMIAELAKEANLPIPAIYIIRESSPNAFATGRDPKNSAVAVTTGLLKILNSSELKGVFAHELAHIYNRDMLISTFSATLASAISSIATFAMFFGGRNSEGRSISPLIMLVFAFLAPIAATIIQLAISRSREFEADRIGSYFTKDPLSLASALKKIEKYARDLKFDTAEKNPSTAQMMIMNPLSGKGLTNLFSTHPSTFDRVAELEELARNENDYQ